MLVNGLIKPLETEIVGMERAKLIDQLPPSLTTAVTRYKRKYPSRRDVPDVELVRRILQQQIDEP